MSSETITRNDLTAILNEVLPNPADMTPQEVEDFVDGLNTQGKSSGHIIVCPSADQTLSTANTRTKCNITTLVSASGSAFTLDSTNHKVIIGAGVDYIEVCGQVYFTTKGTSSVKNAYICKNGTYFGRGVLNMQTDYNTVAVPPHIIQVSAGDEITLEALSQSGTTTAVGKGESGAETYLQIRTI